MKIFKAILINLIFTISLFLLTEFIAREYFYLKHKISFKESLLYGSDKIRGYYKNN